jgi:hypothetical protein
MCVIHQITLAIVLGILTISTSIGFADAPNISGLYKCSYHDPFSTPNDGTEVIRFKKNGDIYKIEETPTGSDFPYFIGKGIFHKNIDNAFGYLIWQLKSPAVTSVQIFTILPDGSLHGVFAQSNRDMIGTETCTKFTE